MATYVPPKKGAALVIYTALTDASDTTLLKANPTLAAGDAKVSKDGGAFANLATLPDVYPAAGYAVRIQLSADEMNADNVVVYLHDAVGTEWCDQLIHVQTVTQQVDDLASQASVDTIDTNVDAILVATGTDIPASIAALNDLSAAELLGTAVEGAYTFSEVLQLMAAVLFGKASGGGTATITFRNTADDADRVIATVDESGNRTAVALNVT